MKLKLKIDTDRLTLEELIAMEEGSIKSRATRDMIAKFVVDDNGEFLPEEEAKAIVGKLNITEAVQAGKMVVDKVIELIGNMVPTKAASE